MKSKKALRIWLIYFYKNGNKKVDGEIYSSNVWIASNLASTLDLLKAG